MKRFFLMMMLFLLAAQASAAPVPKLINYSGKLTDKSGNLVPDDDYDMIFTLYDDPTAGNQVWQESHTSSGSLVPVRGGSFNLILGGLTSFDTYVPPATFDKPYYLEMSFKQHSAPTTAYVTFPRQQLLSTPYAMRAEIANQVADNSITSGKIADGTISTCDIANNTITAAKICDGTITGAKIQNGTITSANITTSTTAGQRIQTINIEDGAVTQAKAPWATTVNGITNPKIWTGSVCTGMDGNSTGKYHVQLAGVNSLATVQITSNRSDQGFFDCVDNVSKSGFDIYTWTNTNTLANCVVWWTVIGN